MNIDFKNLKKFQEARFIHLIKTDNETFERLKPIRDNLDDYYHIDEITEVNEYQIARVRRKKDATEWYYACFINYKALNIMASSFDEALLTCINYKMHRNTSAVHYIQKMLDMSYEPEIIQD